MQQTPAHDFFNGDLLSFMPPDCNRVVEVGCSTGALARAYLKVNSNCHYAGVEIDPNYAEAARKICAEAVVGDVETMPGETFERLFACDCAVFGDTLEHLRDPWDVLRRIRPLLRPGGRVVACIPNAQHWSVQLRLACGLFRYEDAGLLDRTHLRWFTRITALEMFQSCGYRVIDGKPRIFPEAERERFLPAIRAMATAAGFDPDQAVADASPLQYVLVAVPETQV
ncbi:methyltransferase domain-containing protein [Rhodoblastus acidophilus]|uniref:Methyltransferase domain-containing protein n=1 Tax=Candidatus Rhodoblastus alkanivorans TaxID=2954117 RepID=A0ABS9Z426_9HYPH|nr:methyltransferase domain-containing protein [Candidatus Rhodoblastus alkanivorans]MCI4678832.1 methyltransferase domain-containing protein [Candidatus Rhodoblastus alkanivorans]MCI4682221.1 methyltransferase domain-containing protein [Candidatus Rhodoblastus alkanivorans]MDI4639523.1 methyltransferase domain-containing protein [Rhodoblastus acidophilus]